MTGHTIWSFTSSAHSAKPAVVQLQSVSKHPPLHSTAAHVPLDRLQTAQGQQLEHARQASTAQRHLQQQVLDELLQQHINQQQRKTQTTWCQLSQSCSQGVVQQQDVLVTSEHADQGFAQRHLHVAQLGSVPPASHQQLGQHSIEQTNNEQWQRLQWHVVKCCAAPVLPGPMLDAGHLHSVPNQRAVAAAPPLRQPPALYRLTSAAKTKQAQDPLVVQRLLDELQPLLHLLVPDHLAHAAWAAAQLANQCPPSNGWLQSLLDAASLCFQRLSSSQQEVPAAVSLTSTTASSSGGCGNDSADADANRLMSAASVAALLQALVKLKQQPSQAWLSACCSSMAVHQWTCPRALSTVAACLPQLGCVPSGPWAQQFFAASAASLPAFPPISLARMLHGVVALHYSQQEQQQEQIATALGASGNHQQQLPSIPGQWLLDVCHGLITQSSKLKAAEVAMVLQSMHRLQQLHKLLLLPAAGRQPTTGLQQAGQQLLHALMAAVVQQLDQFKAKDLTVMLLAVASLHDQQQELGQQHLQQQLWQQGVSWWWLQRMLTGLETHLPKLDPRGQAACLAATAALVKPHLQRQLLQLQQDAAMLVKPVQQQQQRPQAGVSGSSGQPLLVKPLQRWLQRQQTLGVATAAETSFAAAAAAAADDDKPQQARVHAVSTAPQKPAVAAEDVACYWQGLLATFYEASSHQLSSYSPTDLTVTLCSLASMKQVPPVAWYEQLLHAIQQQLPAMTSGQVSGIAWALGRMALLPSRHDAAVSLVPSAAWMQRLYLGAVRHMAVTQAPEGSTGQQTVHSQGGQTAAGEAAAGMSCDQLLTAVSAESETALVSGTPSCSYSLTDCSPAEIVRLMWAAAVCDYDPGAVWLAAAQQQMLADVPTGAAAQGNGGVLSQGNSSSSSSTTTTIVSNSGSNAALSSSSHRQQPPVHMLDLLLQAYAAASRPVPPGLLQQLVYHPSVLQHLLQVPVVNMLKLLRGLRQAGCAVPLDWLQLYCSLLQPQLTLLSPGELPQLLGCLADAGLNLKQQQQPESAGRHGSTDSGSVASSTYNSGSFRDACLEAGHVLLYRMSLQEASLLLWAGAKLQLRPPPAWLEVCLQAMQASFIDAELPALALALAACSKFGYMPSGMWLGDFMMATHRKIAAMAVSPDSSKLLLVRVVLQLLWALAELGASPNPKWMKLLLLSLHQQLLLLTPRHVTSLLLLLARLKVKPSAVFLQSLVDRLGDFSSCSSLELVKLVYAAAALRWNPSKRSCQLLLHATAGRLGSLTPQGLAVLQWAFAVIRVTPPEPWKVAAVEATMAHLNELDAQCLGMVVWSWGRQMVHLVPKPQEDKAATWQKLFMLQDSQLLPVQDQQSHQQHAGRLRQLQWLLQKRKLLEQQLLQQQQHVQSTESPAIGLVPTTSSSSSKNDALSSKRRQLFEQRAAVVERVLAAALHLKGTYSVSSLVHLLVGVAKMRLAPGQRWLQEMVLHGSREKLSVLNGYELQQLVWAVARLGYTAPAAWLDTVAVLLDVRVTQQQDSTRHSAAWALERLRQQAAVEHHKQL